MTPASTLRKLDRRIATLEQRVGELSRELTNQHSNGNGAHAASEVAGPSIARGDSLFEVLLERVVQGYHRLNDDQRLAKRLVELARSTTDLVCSVTSTATIRNANTAFRERLGYARDTLAGRSLLDLIDKRYRGAITAQLQGLHDGLRQREPTRPEDMLLFQLQCADNSRLSVVALAAVIGDTQSDEYPAGTVTVVMRDLSTDRRLIEELRESRDNYDALSETITEAILRINENLEIVFANSAVKTTFGFEPQELRGRHFSALFPESVYRRNEPDFRKYFVVDDQDRRKLGLNNTIEILGRHKNRGVAPMELSFGNSKDYRGRTLTCIIRDITQRKNAERRLRHLAYHDQLTGLGNRDLFEADMRRIFETPELFKSGYVALMFLDLDGFKQINDTIGHDAGDDLLIQAASRLRKTLRENDAVYRFGGDEFVVLLSFIRERRGASIVANNILGEIRRPFHLTTRTAQAAASVGVSIGIALIPEDGNSLAAATKAADLAMYSAKESGKNRFAFFDRSLDSRAHDRWQLEQGIRTSLERQEFRMSYQPLYDSAGAILGAEALLRWSSPTHGEVSPMRFIPIAEETGMIVPLGSWAIETAFRDASSWPAANHKPLFISVNLSAKQFERADLVDSITGVINRTHIDPQRIILEVTETCVMSAPEESIATLETIKRRHPGLSVAIDDFGTGYSSLSYLTRLPADIIKIDISFVSNLFAMNNEKIVRAIIHLGHSLGMRIIAEGVETAEQREYFVDKGCFAFQGHHFHRSVPATDIAGLAGGLEKHQSPD
ncbi:MAG: EAL domain-containing protein [Spirochaetaceae bacterium]|nr:MAG: EAL domain-containing protein [Spirochaetaceae bacterium]